MLFIGPTLLSGIGQHCKKYMSLFPGSQYIELQNDIPVVNVHLFMLYLYHTG